MAKVPINDPKHWREREPASAVPTPTDAIYRAQHLNLF
jgi:hypothetical protein